MRSLEFFRSRGDKDFMEIDLKHPANSGILSYLSRGEAAALPPTRPPEAIQHAYYTLGSHPDIVERIWDQLSKALPADARCVVYRTPALVHPRGIVLATALGTSYGLRVPKSLMGDARKAGAKTSHTYGGGFTLDLEKEFGPDWIFGGWFKEEETWCRAAYDSFGGE